MRDYAAKPGNLNADQGNLIFPQLAVGALVLLFLVIWHAPPHHTFEILARYEPLHIFFESFSIVISMLVFGAAWHSYNTERSGNIVILGCALLTVGLIDFAHMLSFQGMPDFVTPAGPEKAINFWLAARFVAAAALALVAIRPPQPLKSPSTRYLLLAVAIGLTVVIYWIGIFHEKGLPRTFIEGKGLTPLKVVAEYIIIAIFAVAAALFYARGRRERTIESASLFAAAAISILGELSFTLYSAVTDVFNLLGHVYKIVAYSFIYRAVFVASVHEPFERLFEAKKLIEGEEIALQKAADQIEDLYNNAPCGYHSLDGDGVIVQINDTELKWLGYTREELIGHVKYYELMTPASLRVFQEHFPQLKQRGWVRDIEFEVVRKDGSTFPVLLSGTAVTDSAGNYVMSRSTLYDITELRRVREELELKNRILSTQQETSLDAILLVDEHAKVVSYNRRFVELWNIPEQMVTAAEDEPMLQLVVARAVNPEEFLARVRYLYEHREEKSHEEIRLKDGRILDRYSVPVTGASSRYYGRVWYFRDITERKRIEDALRTSESELKAAQRVAKIGNWHLDLASGAVGWSEEIYHVFDLDPRLPPPAYPEHARLMSAASAERLRAAVENTSRTGIPYEIDLEVPRGDGTSKWITARGEAVRDDHGRIVSLRGTAQDISERKQAENAIRKSNRALRVLSSCNQALVHATEEQQLFEIICRAIVEEGGFRLAWVGMAEQDADRTVRPVAQRGFEEGYLETLKITWADTERGRGPTGTAVRAGTTQINQNVAANPAMAPWRDDALKRGYRSSIALPLKSGPAVLGVLDIYAAEPDAFDAEEVRLLEELADDLAFGITVLRARAAHARAEAALRDSEERFRKISSSAQDAIILMDHEGKVAFWNEAAQKMYGYSSQEIIGRDLHAVLVPDRYRVEFEPGLRKFFATGEGPILDKPRELMALRKDGTEFPIEMIVSRISINDKWHAAAMARDITERIRAQKALHDSEASYRSIFENANTPIAATDASGHVASFNEAFRSMLGYDAEALSRMNFADFTHPDDLRLENIYFNEILSRQRDHYRMEKRYIANGGRILWVDLSSSAIRDVNGEVQKFVAVIVDITERKIQESKIARLSRIQAVLSGINSLIVRVQDRQELLDGACRIAVEHGGFGIAWISMWDPATQEVAPIACAGVDTAFFLAQAPTSVAPDSPMGRGEVGRAIRGKRAVFNNQIAAEPGAGGPRRQEAVRRGYRSLVVLPLLLEDAVAGVLTLYAKEPDFFNPDELKLLDELAGDISFALDHLAKKETVNYLAYYDVLTGLPNRTLFIERTNQFLQLSLQAGTMTALILLDIERFRYINDTLGRHGGDAVLKMIAQRLVPLVGAQSSLARVGADVFAIAISSVAEASDIAHFVEKQINSCFAQPFSVGNSELRISARLGVSVSPGDGRDVDTLYKNAESALLKAKEIQEPYLFYAPEMNARVTETLNIENKLRKAVEEQQFVLHYQPKYDSKSRRIIGMEALIRWNDPETGLVPPFKFISILEETGLILPVGAWAMKQAVTDYRRWREQHLNPPHIAVNVSEIQLRRKDFVSTVEEACRFATSGDHGLDLEITESLIMRNIEDNIAKLAAIREMGSEIAIDDFGTGYSSLRYLSQLPMDSLKIDRSFIIRMQGSPADMAIVSTIIALAHDLDLKVVAEGVETEDQAKLLRLLKCDEMQGYLFSKPVPAEQIEAMLGKLKSAPKGKPR